MEKTAMQIVYDAFESLDMGTFLDILEAKREELLEKEKNQIVDAFVSGSTNRTYDTEYGDLAEDYFNSTYQESKTKNK